MSEGNTVYARGFTSPAELGRSLQRRAGGRSADRSGRQASSWVTTASLPVAAHVTAAKATTTTLIMTESARESRAGDKLSRAASMCRLISFPARRGVKTNGRIIAVADGVTIIGQYEVVVVNRGARDGLAPGNVLACTIPAPWWPTPTKRASSISVPLGAKKVRLPSERTGTFMVFKTFDNISYGLDHGSHRPDSRRGQNPKPVRSASGESRCLAARKPALKCLLGYAIIGADATGRRGVCVDGAVARARSRCPILSAAFEHLGGVAGFIDASDAARQERRSSAAVPRISIERRRRRPRRRARLDSAP